MNEDENRNRILDILGCDNVQAQTFGTGKQGFFTWQFMLDERELMISRLWILWACRSIKMSKSNLKIGGWDFKVCQTYPYEVAFTVEPLVFVNKVGSANGCSNEAYLRPLYWMVFSWSSPMMVPSSEWACSFVMADD
jgi:hypothetical protein